MHNRLADEASPYLRQHADNPVAWQPWDAQALAAARAADKPILLSIGYSACHWCHVMAHESFEDPATAALMNDLFVCIKVDREERPDLDRIYQLAHQALSQRGGGWPLTVFIAPDDLTPFYAGTYFPKTPRYGTPPFGYVLEQVRAFWDTRRADVQAQNAALRNFLDAHGRHAPHDGALDAALVQAARAQIGAHFDPVHGGRRGAPKFPHAPELELLRDLRDDAAQAMAALTLRRMAAGGIHDQLGGGFCRYSVDERWEIPHFEKMLYDNAQLLPLYAEGDEDDRTVARRLVDWLAREMRAPDAMFYAALDADSEGEEGRFYLWQPEEVHALLGADAAIAFAHWGFDRPPNFENHAWNPVLAVPAAALATTSGRSDSDVHGALDRARAALLGARNRRVRPGLDDKCLTGWNALMIAGLARAARSDTRLADAGALALAALDALRGATFREGRLLAKAGPDAARFPAYLDDHAFLLEALLECLQWRWRDADLAAAMALADTLLAQFEDTAEGGFWFTAHDHEALLQRPKPWADEALPSGNGVAARALLRLGHLIGEPRYLDAAERTLRAAWSAMREMPAGCATLQRALLDFTTPPAQVVIRIDTDVAARAWHEALAGVSLRRVDVYVIGADAGTLPGVLAAQAFEAGGVAWLCRGTHCEPPLRSPAALAAALAGVGGAGGA